LVKSANYLYYAAAAATAGISQLFWALPMARRRERIWYYIGIGGTIVLIIIYFVTRVPNPITEGRALQINSIGIATEIFQFIYIGITIFILTRKIRTPVVIAKNWLQIAELSFFTALAFVIVLIFGIRNESLLFIVLIFGIYLVVSGRISRFKFMELEVMVKDVESKQLELKGVDSVEAARIRVNAFRAALETL
jgi:hypothetical protein